MTERMTVVASSRLPRRWILLLLQLRRSTRCRLLSGGKIPTTPNSERGGDDDFNDNCEVPASEDAEMMGWDTYDDDYVGS